MPCLPCRWYLFLTVRPCLPWSQASLARLLPPWRRDVPRPQAVLVVSPHWMTRGAKVQTGPAPVTLHDFGGFPPALYQLRYPSPRHPVLARRTNEILNQAGWAAEEDPDRGFDHGAWVPMTYLYPRADVPMFQVSLPAHLDAARAYKYPLESQLVMFAKVCEDVIKVGQQGFGVAGLERHPLALDFAPEDLDAVELRAIRRQMKARVSSPRWAWALSASISDLARQKAASHRFF